MVDQKCGMIAIRVRPAITEDFTITTICLHGIPSFAGTPQVQVLKCDPFKATFGSVTKNSLAPFVFFDTKTFYVGEPIFCC